MRPPPGYPFAGDIPSRPLPPGTAGVTSPLGAAFVLAFAGAMTGAGFMLVALVSTPHRTGEARPPVQLSFAPDDGEVDEPGPASRVVDSPLPPPVERNVPVHPGRFLEGCSSADLATMERILAATIGTGAPLYNSGDIAGCADAYEKGARELEQALPSSCPGPSRALAEGRTAAGKLALPSARAWALRDAFDGLIEVVDRSRQGGIGSL